MVHPLVQVSDSVSGTITRAYDNLDRVISEVTPHAADEPETKACSQVEFPQLLNNTLTGQVSGWSWTFVP